MFRSTSAAYISTPFKGLRASNRTARSFSHFRHQLSASDGELRDEALRILYCGSDSFSSTSLQALYQESQRSSSNIASIDVVCREGKPYGRGLRWVRHPEIKNVATSLGLPVHQINTFGGWKPPEYPNSSAPKINLIIAVSFGLFIPQRILNSARFAGMNLHPSLLPEYKGPAPLHWTILNGDKKTGMSLQTLHPTSFDEGVILDQTPWPGIDVPEDCDYPGLLKIMQPLGAEMLVKAIRERLYLPPHVGKGWAGIKDEGKSSYRHAPKIETAHRLLCFETMDSLQMSRMSRAFESTWAFAAVSRQTADLKKLRVIFQGPLKIVSPPVNPNGHRIVPEVPPGLPYWPHDGSQERKELENHPLLVNTIDGKVISMDSIKVEGDVQMPAYRAARKHKLIGQPRYFNSKRIIAFHDVLTAR